LTNLTKNYKKTLKTQTTNTQIHKKQQHHTQQQNKTQTQQQNKTQTQHQKPKHNTTTTPTNAKNLLKPTFNNASTTYTNEKS